MTLDYKYTTCLRCDFLRGDDQSIDFPIMHAVKVESLFT